MTDDDALRIIGGKLPPEQIARLAHQLTSGTIVSASANTADVIAGIGNALDLNEYRRGPGTCQPTPAVAEPTDVPELKGLAARNLWFLKMYEAKNTPTYHSPARITQAWNAMTKEQWAAICPAATTKVTRDVVVIGIKRARKLLDADSSKPKRTAKKRRG